MYTNYHEYAMERGPDYVHFYIDGKIVLNSTAVEKVKSVTDWFHNDSPYYIWLNTAIGGWAGKINSTSSTIFPQYNYIDYVKVSTRAIPGEKPSLLESLVAVGAAVGMLVVFATIWHCSRKNRVTGSVNNSEEYHIMEETVKSVN